MKKMKILWIKNTKNKLSGLIVLYLAIMMISSSTTTQARTSEGQTSEVGLQMYTKVFYPNPSDNQTYGLLLLTSDFPNDTQASLIDVVVHASIYTAGEVVRNFGFKLRIWDVQGSYQDPGDPQYINPENEESYGTATRTFTVMAHLDNNGGVCIFKAEITDIDDDLNIYSEITMKWGFGTEDRERADDTLDEEEVSKKKGFFEGLGENPVIMIMGTSGVCFLYFGIRNKEKREGYNQKEISIL